MARFEGVEFLSLGKTEDRFLLIAFACLILSLYFGLMPGLVFMILWAAIGIVALICIYFAFPNMWPYCLLLYAVYGISAFGVILLVFWYDVIKFLGISIPVMIGIFFIASAFYIAYYIVKNVKKTRDVFAAKRNYLPLGFWSISVMLFPLFSILSIFSWSNWVDSGELQFYLILEPLIAILLIYILWLPDRNIDWSLEHLPEPPVKKLIAKRSKVIKEKVTKIKNICPECGLKLKIERKSCPSCNNTQTFGWCMTSEAYVLPCPHCGSMAMYGKEKCDKCGKSLTDSVICNSCKKAFNIKEWIAQQA